MTLVHDEAFSRERLSRRAIEHTGRAQAQRRIQSQDPQTALTRQNRNRSGLLSEDFRKVLEIEARIARMEMLRRVAFAERANEIGFHLAIGEEGRVDTLIVEAGHRPAI